MWMLSSVAAAQTVLTVCEGGACNYTSIQAALDHTPAADEIELTDSVRGYAGFSIDNRPQPVTIRGPVGQVAIVAGALPLGRFVNIVASTVVLQDLRITNLSRRLVTIEESTVTMERVEIDGGAAPEGAGIRLTDATLTIIDGSVHDNVGVEGAAISLQAGSTLLLTTTSLHDNIAIGRGGAILVGPGSTVDMVGGTIERNEANRGGGIFALEGTIGLSGDARILDNTAGLQGGGLFLLGGALTMTDAVMRRNDAVSGGQLYALGGVNPAAVNLDSTEITGGSALLLGGGLLCRGGTVELSGSTFVDNSATLGGHGYLERCILTDQGSTFEGGIAGIGGGLYLQGYFGPTTATLAGATFEGNHAEAAGAFSVASGGAVYVDDGADLVLDGVTATSNHSDGDGGVVAGRLAGDVTVTGGTWTANSASGNGGGIGLEAPGSLSVTGLVSVDDDAGGFGGGIWALQAGGEVVVSDSTFEGSQASQGAALLLDRCAANLRGNVFTSTHAGEVGGAIALLSSGIFSAQGNAYCNTEADGLGGAIAVLGGCMGKDCTLRHERFSGNVAARGGVLYVDNAPLELSHISVRDPVADQGSVIDIDGTHLTTMSRSWIRGASGSPIGNLDGVTLDLVNIDGGAAVPPATSDPTVLLQGADFGSLDCGVEFRIHPDSPLADRAPGSVDLGAFEGPEPSPEWSEDIDGDGVPWRYDCDDGRASVGGTLPEACDGIDNDCDGVVDEDCTCEGPDGCDGIDNDCDGVIDEDCTCVGPDGCDGFDDDCDGQVDEDCGCGPNQIPGTELCDGIDNDCDGLVDEVCSTTLLVGGGGCGCASGTPAPSVPWGIAALIWLRRRRRAC